MNCSSDGMANVNFSCCKLDVDEFQSLAIIVNEFIITFGFGGRGTKSIRGCVLFCSKTAAMCGLIEGTV